MKNNTSTAVSGEDFMFRDYEKNYCINSLKEGNSILILGIRRTGKSSLMKEVARLMNMEGYKIIIIDCQDCHKPSELFLEILKSLPKDTFQKFTEYISTIKGIPKSIIDVFNVESIKGFGVDLKFDQKIRDYWIPISRSVENILLNNGEKIILFLDELPYFFENLIDPTNKGNFSEVEVKQILATLRSWRNEGIQMFLCGSLNIRYFLNSNSVSEKLLAGLSSIDMSLFSENEAKELLKALANSKNITWITDEMVNRIIELIQDNVPFFVQTFFSFLLLEKECSNERLEEIYHTVYYPKIRKEFLYQFNERLSNYSQEEQRQVDVILDYIAISNEASLEEIRAKNNSIELKVLLKLVTDEFLKYSNQNNYTFILNIVKHWWKENRGI
jgi:hypothetical protein